MLVQLACCPVDSARTSRRRRVALDAPTGIRIVVMFSILFHRKSITQQHKIQELDELRHDPRHESGICICKSHDEVRRRALQEGAQAGVVGGGLHAVRACTAWTCLVAACLWCTPTRGGSVVVRCKAALLARRFDAKQLPSHADTRARTHARAHVHERACILPATLAS